jgi:hypothetical protein
MSATIPDPSGAPSVPPVVRSVAYYVGLCSGAVTPAVVATVAVLHGQDAAVVAAALSAAWLSAVVTITGGLGVIYRPTR